MGTNNILMVVLPLFALIIGSLSVAAIWLWWTMSREEDLETSTSEDQYDEMQGEESGGAEQADATLGDVAEQTRTFFSTLGSSIKSGINDMAARREAKFSEDIELPSRTTRSSRVDPAGTVEVMRVFRDIADGSIVIEVADQRFRSLDEMQDPEIQRRFLGNAKAIVEFTRRENTASMTDISSVPPSDVSATDVPDVPTATSNAPAAAMPDSSSEEPEPIALGGVSRLTNLFGSSEQEEDEPQMSMAEEIEEILQKRLAAHHEFSTRSIHIRSAHDGGVRIEVDGTSYEAVGDVRDDGVREFILTVIQEWEARQ